MKCVRLFWIALLLGSVLPAFAEKTPGERSFVHPGMLHTREDLVRMKQQAEIGERPTSRASLEFQPRPFTHVIRGSYGRPNIGGRELGDSANAAYNHALQWAITGNQAHADKAIEILNAWSPVLWDFDDNDSKLLAGWTGQKFCNAAEILRYTDAGWQAKDIVQFERMLRTAYYPLIENFFPEANGNWDAALMNTMLCVGIFCDDRGIFDRAVNHFLRGPGNSGITKYIYPSGQCQENTRDQSHTQLGLGELATGCQVAWNQGVDLFGAADNRLALGFEYTAKYMLGEDVQCYGTISRNGRGRFRDIYGPVYRHYTEHKGIDMPYTKRAAERSRNSGIDLEVVAESSSILKGAPRPSPIAARAGAQSGPTDEAPGDAIKVEVGQSIQEALDACPAGGWVVLAKGLHTLPAALKIPSGITLAGQGIETIIFLDPELKGPAIVNAGPDFNNVIVRDLVVEGATTSKTSRDPNQDRRQRSYQMVRSRAGIAFSANRANQMSGIRLEHVTVRNCTHNGVAIRGAAKVVVLNCDFSDSGSSVVPGPGLHHNLLITRSRDCEVSGSRLDTSPWGCGIDLSYCRQVTLENNEAARNALNGIRITDSEEISVIKNLAEGNDQSGIRFYARMDGSRGIEVHDNLVRNNAGYGIEISHVVEGSIHNNRVLDNKHPEQIHVASSERVVHK